MSRPLIVTLTLLVSVPSGCSEKQQGAPAPTAGKQQAAARPTPRSGDVSQAPARRPTAPSRPAVTLPRPTGAPPAEAMGAARPVAAHGVDCRAMCSRTFLKCAEQVFVASGKMSSALIETVKRSERWAKVQQVGNRACLKGCLEKKGLGTDAADIRRCLALPTCDAYAACMKKHIK